MQKYAIPGNMQKNIQNLEIIRIYFKNKMQYLEIYKKCKKKCENMQKNMHKYAKKNEEIFLKTIH